LVENVRGLKGPMSRIPGPVRMLAEAGVRWSWVGDGGGVEDEVGLYIRGRRG